MAIRSLKEAVKGPAMRLLGYREERVSVATWDKEYREGGWKFLENISSLAGQISVFGYLQFLAPATILDVGCGAGLLAKKLKLLPYKSLLGVDISAEAIAQAASVADERTSFAVADANAFHTDRVFDAIVFNQCLNYFPDPAAVAEHYTRFLARDGHFIVSMAENARARVVWELIDRPLVTIDAMTFIQADGRGTTKVMRPRG